ncbi:MAG: leucine-rich repeat protein [Paludibacteraceae bacterium]|nr:leucine-rich repeat protein [Paludibacteraceae bacterium]
MRRIQVIILMIICGVSMYAHDFEVKNAEGVSIWYNNVTSKYNYNAVEVSFRGTWYDAYKDEYKGTVILPNEITTGGKTYKVVGIGEQAFSQCTSLRAITIPENILYIGNKAFESCGHVHTVHYNAVRCADFTLPEFAPFSYSVMTAGGYVYTTDPEDPDSYWTAYDLKTINIGASVERVPDYMFYGMGGRLPQVDYIARKITYTYGGVTAVNFLGVPTELGNQAFRSCPQLRKITIPDGVKEFGQALFADCDTLSSVTLPKDMTEIPAYFFMNCKELTNFTFPSAVTRINYEAFKNCPKLTDLSNLPAGLTVIGPSAFRACEHINNVVLPATLTTISGYSFSDCTSLTSIDIPASVEAIGAYAFEDCTNLSAVTLHEGTKELGNFVFAGCRKLSKGVVKAPAKMPRIYAQTFQGVDNTMTVEVEGGDNTEYAADEYWGRFFAPQAVENTSAEKTSVKKVIINGAIYIKKDNKMFDILGKEITL